MKHKFISISIALVLALSLCLVTAVPVGAVGFDYSFTVTQAFKGNNTEELFDFTEPVEYEGVTYFGWDPLTITTSVDGGQLVVTVEAPEGLYGPQELWWPENFGLAFDADCDGVSDWKISYHSVLQAHYPEDYWSYAEYDPEVVEEWLRWSEHMALPSWIVPDEVAPPTSPRLPYPPGGKVFTIRINMDKLGQQFRFGLVMVEAGHDDYVPAYTWQGGSAIITAPERTSSEDLMSFWNGEGFYLLGEPGEVWVDDDADTEWYDLTHFAAIQDGINAVAEDGTVNVAAGTYNENIVIDKWLTLQGAGNGSDPGSNTVIMAGAVNLATIEIKASGNSETEHLVVKALRVTGATGRGNTGSGIIGRKVLDIGHITFESVASVGNEGHGIAFDITGTVSDIVLNNCILSDNFHGFRLPSSASATSDIAVNDCDFDNNVEGGIMSYSPLDGLTVDGGTFTRNAFGIMVGAESDTPRYIRDVSVTGATFDDNNKDPSYQMGFHVYVYGSTEHEVSSIQVRDCSFTNHQRFGVSFSDSGLAGYDDVVIDATNNWWGHASGPIPPGTYESYGDAVRMTSGTVDYEPWLLEEGGTTYEKTLALKDGWTLISTDKLVAATGSTWVGKEDLGAGKTVLAHQYTGVSYLQVDLPDGLKPIDALYVKTAGGGGVGINYSPGAPGLSSKELVAGWNLISSGTIAEASAVLSPLRDIATEGTGLTTLVSQGSYNQHTEGWYIDATDWSLSGNKMNPFDGYWIYMNAAKSFGVISD